ncbi:carotenoid oxygenase family protein [Bernardetia sp. ABR2-2B]|uniref:carotenoid oxygenase family protein n=1 Tax=Bernardetia sp. ABR2-2B TaxID=3127472 RepID=UPI0030D27CE7
MDLSYFTAASREELDLELKLLEGALPKDMTGVVYINSSVGTVNSGGIPFPKTNPDGTYNRELGSPLLGGDGMIYKLDFNQEDNIKLSSRLLKPPSYYADHATRYYLEDKKKKNSLFKMYGFRNLGLTRMSFTLGVRNELCTNVTPFQFERDENPRILANYDAGRPYEFDTTTMDIKTPIGANSEWITSTPPFLVYPFPVVQSTAHPFFDPNKQELISVNFVKSIKTMVSQIKWLELLKGDPKNLEKSLEKYIDNLEDKSEEEVQHDLTHKHKLVQNLNDFFENVEEHVSIKSKWWKNLIHQLEERIEEHIKKETTVVDTTYLMSWKGTGEWKKWTLIDNTTQKPLVIQQCMHQFAVTKDYVILIDAGFKLTLDIMFNNPFPHNPKIDKFFRKILTAPMLASTDTYLVKRSDMREDTDTIVIKKLPIDLPFETIHITADYENPNNEITIHAAHNATACLAEWIRIYDINEFTKKVIDEKISGIPPTGILDISRIGKYKIDAKTGSVIEQNIVTKKGNIDDPQNVGSHTWGIALFTYKNMIDANRTVSKIKDIYWQSFGLDKDFLTEFIYRLYKDYPHRQVPLEEIRKYTERGVPFVISRMNTETMEFEDYYQFPKGISYRAMQFVQKEGTDFESREGYMTCVVTNPQQIDDKTEPTYRTELWVFDAMNLKKGAICKLHHPDWVANTTLHSAWLPKAQPSSSYYDINVREDYQHLIDDTLFGEFLGGILFSKQRKQIQKIFDKYVYPHFE